MIAFSDYKAISGAVKKGEERSIEFTATRPGKVLYGCYIPCGQGHVAMKGILEVSG